MTFRLRRSCRAPKLNSFEKAEAPPYRNFLDPAPQSRIWNFRDSLLADPLYTVYPLRLWVRHTEGGSAVQDGTGG
jgi:hypothetical protein